MHILYTMNSNTKIFTDQDESDDNSDDESDYRVGPLLNNDSSDDEYSSTEASN